MKMLSDHYREKFGCKVYKLSLDGGFFCPNRAGTCGSRGCISCLPEHIMIHRLTGNGAKKDLIAPAWSADKKRVMNYLHKVLEK